MKKLIGSIIFFLVILVGFNVALAVSRNELRVWLRDIYGNTWSIHQLTIEGRVSGGSWAGRWTPSYGYTFSITPYPLSDGGGFNVVSDIEMHVFTDRRGHSDFVGPPSWMIPWNPHFFETRYFPPFGEYELVHVHVEGGGSQALISGEIVPMPEWRIYSDIFAADVRWLGHRVVVPERVVWEGGFALVAPHRLFVDAGEGAYLFTTAIDRRIEEFSNNFWTIGRGQGQSVPSHLLRPLTNSFTVGDLHVFVPTGPRLFGETSVYGVHVEGGRIGTLTTHTTHHHEQTPVIAARSLIDIELERGQDEILGLIRLADGFLLLIMRGEILEITRYCFDTGAVLTVEQAGAIRPTRIYEQGSTLLFTTEHEGVMWTMDVGEGGVIVTDPAAFALGGRRGAYHDPYRRPHIHIHDALTRDGVVYFVYTMEENPWRNHRASTETFIAAFDTDGRLIGRAQLMNGVEEDSFWLHAPQGGINRPFARSLLEVTIR